MTLEEALQKLTKFRTFSESVLINLNIPNNLLELDKAFFAELHDELKKELLLSHALNTPITPSVKFILELFKDAN